MKKNYYILRLYKNGEVQFGLKLTKDQAATFELNGQDPVTTDNLAGGVTKWFRIDVE